MQPSGPESPFPLQGQHLFQAQQHSASVPGMDGLCGSQAITGLNPYPLPATLNTRPTPLSGPVWDSHLSGPIQRTHVPLLYFNTRSSLREIQHLVSPPNLKNTLFFSQKQPSLSKFEATCNPTDRWPSGPHPKGHSSHAHLTAPEHSEGFILSACPETGFPIR